jgi:hypothetical protein
MRPARGRVANLKKEAAAVWPPLGLRRACWRSFPEPQEDFRPSCAFFGRKRLGLKRKREHADEGMGRRYAAKRRSSPQRGPSERAALTPLLGLVGGRIRRCGSSAPARSDLPAAEHVEDDAAEERDRPVVPGPEPLQVRRSLDQPDDQPDEACDDNAPFEKTPRMRGFWKAAGLGFEPRLPDPESGVLPLDDPARAGPL